MSQSKEPEEGLAALLADVLVEERASFKFAGALDRVALLTGGRADRGGGGKFITVYPDDPELFRRLARRLHAATLGLRGPRILSDRPYAPGSLVHDRYGGPLGPLGPDRLGASFQFCSLSFASNLPQ